MVLVLVYDNLGKDIRSGVIAAYDGNRGGSLDYLRVGRILVRFAAKNGTLCTFHPKLCGIAVQRTGYILADYVIIVRIDVLWHFRMPPLLKAGVSVF